MKTRNLTTILLSGALLTLSACGDGAGNGGDKPAAARPASSANMMPEDPELAALYRQSCYSCHANGAGGAPRTGAPAWQPRMAKGMDTLMNHTINGYKGMPPLGMCMDCGEEEFEALIRFMAGEQ